MGIPDTLNGVAEGVPNASQPFCWNMREAVEENILKLEARFARYTGDLPYGCNFDEAAIMVPSLFHRARLVEALEVAGWQVFNEAEDLVYTNPFGTRYFVAYMFLRHPKKRYRLEVMIMSEGEEDMRPGFSPLHASLWPDGERPYSSGSHLFPVPHLSFKATNIQGAEGKHRSYSMAIRHLGNQGFVHAQTCQSTYGHFGYYLHQDAREQLYIKPRVNTRDDA